MGTPWGALGRPSTAGRGFLSMLGRIILVQICLCFVTTEFLNDFCCISSFACCVIGLRQGGAPTYMWKYSKPRSFALPSCFRRCSPLLSPFQNSRGHMRENGSIDCLWGFTCSCAGVGAFPLFGVCPGALVCCFVALGWFQVAPGSGTRLAPCGCS